MKKRAWIVWLLALTVFTSLLAGCTKKPDTAAEPEKTQTEQQPSGQEQTPEEQQPDTPGTGDPQPETDTPDTEDKPEGEPQTELTEEEKRRRQIEDRVRAATIWDDMNEFDTNFSRERALQGLVWFLDKNWDNFDPAISTYFEADDFRLNLYQNSLDEYICVLSHTDSFQECYLRADTQGSVSVFVPGTETTTTQVSGEIAALIDKARYDKRYDGIWFDSDMDKTANDTFRAYAAQAIDGFRQTLEDHKTAWKPVLDDAFRATVLFDENDQFVFDLQCKSLYWLELRYVPGHGVWSDIALVPNEEENWELDESLLTDSYLLSLVMPLEIGMTAESFSFDAPSDLSQQQLWLCYLLLTPESEKEATYQTADKQYHVTEADMRRTLSKYFAYYKLDITQDAAYDAQTKEIVTPLVSGFGGGLRAQLRTRSAEGDTVTFTADFYAEDDAAYAEILRSKTYTITFRYGGYTYDSAVEAQQA